jgi:hypothetical protein
MLHSAYFSGAISLTPDVVGSHMNEARMIADRTDNELVRDELQAADALNRHAKKLAAFHRMSDQSQGIQMLMCRVRSDEAML